MFNWRSKILWAGLYYCFTLAGVLGNYKYYDPETGGELLADALKGRPYVLRTFDLEGNRISDALFDGSARPIIKSGDNFHLIEYGYDENGNEISVAFFGLKKEPVSNNGGFHLCRRTFVDLTKIKSIGYYGTSGERVAIKGFDFHIIENTYNDKGDLATTSYYDVDGHNAVNEYGIHLISFDYDEKGRETSRAYFDRTGNPTTDVSGAHRTKRAYDETGRISSITFIDVNGENINPAEGK